MPAITVAIPTYRRDDYLAAALESVLAQTVDDLEIVVSDNADSALTRDLVRSYSDPRVSYAPLAQNIGLHGNLTRCMHLGSAPYVAVLLDDDAMAPTNLEAKLALLERHPTAGVAHSALSYIDEGGAVSEDNVNWTGRHDPAELETGVEFIERTMGLGNRICASSALMRREAVAQLCHDERDGTFCDVGVWLRMATAWDVAYIDEPLTVVRIHPDSDSARQGLYELDGDELNISTFEMTSASRAAKFRFIDEYVDDPRERVALRHLVRDRARTELKEIVAERTLATRRPTATARSLGRAARVEPSLWWSPWSGVLLASSVLGRRLFDLAVEARSGR
jgi:glycosyltransferase involved in cell wall biosynthesis